MILSLRDLMGEIEKPKGLPHHESLPSTKDIFPINILPINRAALALRDTRDPNEFVFEEKKSVSSPFFNYLERYYTKFAHAQNDSDNPVDKLSFFVGAMLVHRIIREQVSDLNEDLSKKLNATPALNQIVTLPQFEDSERLFNSEMKSFNYWKAESGHLDSDFETAASNRLLKLADPELADTGDLDMNFAAVLFYISTQSADHMSFYTGAGATYFAIKNAIAENQQFEELLKYEKQTA